LYTCRSPCWCEAYDIFYVYRVVLGLDLLFRRCLVHNCIFGGQIYIEICMVKMLLHCCTIGGCCVGGSKLYLCAVSGVLVTYCVGYSCCSVERLSLFQRGVLFRVAIGLSDLSHGTRLLLYGGWRGTGGSGVIVWFYWGFSKAYRITPVIPHVHSDTAVHTSRNARKTRRPTQ